MKTFVSDQHLSEVEIKPPSEIDEYRTLLDKEFRRFLADGAALHRVSCPGCGSDVAETAFEKSGLGYMECCACATVYASPRPSASDIENFYRTSNSLSYWRRSLLPASREARAEKIFRPQAEWLLDTLDRYSNGIAKALAVGQHSDLLLGELVRMAPLTFDVVVTNPLSDLEFEELPFDRVKIVPSAYNDLVRHAPADAIMAFDVIDRCGDLDGLFESFGEVLASDGLLFASSTLITGLDLQTLWDKSERIYPPERLNLLSVEGVAALARRHNFEILEFSTPGVFDVEIVQNAIRRQPHGDWPRFLRYLTKMRDRETLEALQEYLQRFRLSSFARLVFRKL
jgi:hypothetical protein